MVLAGGGSVIPAVGAGLLVTLVAAPPERGSGPDRHRDALHGVVRIPADVPLGDERLLVAGLVACPAEELVVAGRRLPDEAPACPRPRAELRLDLGGGPDSAAVDAHLDRCDRGEARPGTALEGARAGVHDPVAREEVRDTRRRHQRPRPDARERDPLVVLVAPQPVRARLLVAVERPLEDGDPLEPLHVRHAVPAGDDEPQRGAVLRRKRRAVQVVGEQDVLPKGLVERQAPFVRLLDAAIDAPVGAGEEHLLRPLGNTRLDEQRAQRNAGPLPGPDRLGAPRLAHRSRVEVRPSVAGALHRHDRGRGRSGAQVVQRQRELAFHLPPDPEPPAVGHHRDVEVGEQVVEPDRRDGIAERLERQAVVPRRELELLERDRHSASLVEPPAALAGALGRDPRPGRPGSDPMHELRGHRSERRNPGLTPGQGRLGPAPRGVESLTWRSGRRIPSVPMPSLPRIKRTRRRTRPADIALTHREHRLAELDAGGLVWVHLTAPSAEEIAALSQRFGWHPLDLEDVLSKRQRPKIDEYPNYLFGVLHFPVYDKTVQRLNAGELDFFL